MDPDTYTKFIPLKLAVLAVILFGGIALNAAPGTGPDQESDPFGALNKPYTLITLTLCGHEVGVALSGPDGRGNTILALAGGDRMDVARASVDPYVGTRGEWEVSTDNPRLSGACGQIREALSQEAK